MQLIPVQTKVFTPPRDDLYEALDASLPEVQEGDIVLITSKIVSIHQGRCVPLEENEKEALVRTEADLLRHVPERKYPLTIKHHALISGAGIDESNGDGYYILLPEDPFKSAEEIHTYLKKKHGLDNVGVVITDSHSLPFRYGAMSISISFWGLEPVEQHAGKQDLFGREFRIAATNLVDSLAAASALVSGECAECQPVVIARGVPHIRFTEEDVRDKLLVPREQDLFKALFEKFHK